MPVKVKALLLIVIINLATYAALTATIVLFVNSIALLTNIILVLSAATLFSTLFWWFYSDRVIFSRIRTLVKQVYQLKLEKSFERKIKIDGHDELSELGKSINELVQTLSWSEKNYLKANEAIKAKALELEKKTTELEKLNQHMVGREVRMSQLKKEIEDLKKKLEAKNG